MQWIKDNHIQFARIGSVLTVLIATAVFLWPAPAWEAKIGEGSALAVALGAWVYAEIQSFTRKTAHPHDLALFKTVQALFDANEIAFLKRHDFGNSFRADYLNPIFEVGGLWEGARYEFHDKATQKKFADFLVKCQELSLLLSQYSFPTKNNFQSVVPDNERARDYFSYQTTELIRYLNDKATWLAESFELFEKTARSKLHVAL